MTGATNPQPDTNARPPTQRTRTLDLRELANHATYREVYYACHVTEIGHE